MNLPVLLSCDYLALNHVTSSSSIVVIDKLISSNYEFNVLQILGRGPRSKTSNASFSRTNNTANKRGRQKKSLDNVLNFTYFILCADFGHLGRGGRKTQPRQNTAGNC